MAQQTAMLGRVMLVLERESVSLRTNGGGQQEQDKYNRPPATRPSCHADYYTEEPRRTATLAARFHFYLIARAYTYR